MTLVRRNLKDHHIPNHLPWAGMPALLDQFAQCPIHPSLQVGFALTSHGSDSMVCFLRTCVTVLCMPWVAAKIEVYCNSLSVVVHLEGRCTTFCAGSIQEAAIGPGLMCDCSPGRGACVVQSVPEQAGLQLIRGNISFTQTLKVVVEKRFFTEIAEWP